MSRFNIAEISANTDPDVFLKEFYEPGQPVLIRGIPLEPGLEEAMTPEILKELLLGQKSEDAEANNLWWDVNDRFLAKFPGKFEQPGLLQTIQAKTKPRQGKYPYRFWASSKDTPQTPWHYDGSSIDGFNLQVIGRKRFTLVDPDTPLEYIRFKPYSPKFLSPPDEEHRWTEFETRPGDMLYLPRHWFHKVESLDEWNVNMNWTWFDPKLPFNTKTSWRERETVAILYYLFRVLDKVPRRFLSFELRGMVEYVKHYGATDESFAVAREFSKSATFPQLLRRLREEMKLMTFEQLHHTNRDQDTILLGVRRLANDYWGRQAS